MPTDNLRIALCLSGGGLRATFFHLGVIKLLQKLDLLRRVTHICSVSGGSILAAHLVLNWGKYTDATGFADAEKELIDKLGTRDIRGRVVRRWLLTWFFPFMRLFPAFSQRTRLLERQYAQIFSKTSKSSKAKSRPALFNDLADNEDNPRPALYILATNFTTGDLCAFSSDGFWIDDGKKTTLIGTTLIPLPFAVAASSAFPPLFPPAIITHKKLNKGPGQLGRGSLPRDPDYLSDGGVFDNLGFQKLIRLVEKDSLKFDYLLLSDAGASFEWNVTKRFRSIISRTIRATDILMNRVSALTVSTALSTEAVVHIPISHIVKTNKWRAALPFDVQEKLPRIRTDLDCFSSDEIDLLSRHGYEVCLDQLRTLPKLQGVEWEKITADPDDLRTSQNIQEDIESLVRKIDAGAKRKGRIFHKSDWASYALCSLGVMFAAGVLLPLAVFYGTAVKRITCDLSGHLCPPWYYICIGYWGTEDCLGRNPRAAQRCRHSPVLVDAPECTELLKAMGEL